MNIMINNYCNLKCDYCFAHNLLNKEIKNMSIDNYLSILNFLKKSNEKSIRLIGGEPTLHPQFSKLLDIYLQDDYFQSLVIFSNCLFNENVLKSIFDVKLKKKILIAPNINSKDDIGEEKYKLIENNIKYLSKINAIESLGVNIYKLDQDIEPIFMLAKENNIRKIRWSLAIHKRTENNIIEKYVKDFEPLLVKFINKAAEYNIIIERDCNSLPLCLLKDETVRLLSYVSPIDLINDHRTACIPTLDIDPSLNIYRCFGVSNHKKSFEDYKNKTIRDLLNDFKSDFYELEHKPLFENCKQCLKYKMNDNKSCSCLKYK